MTCPKCGATVDEGENFCQACGASMTETPAEVVDNTATATAEPLDNPVQKKRATLMLVFGIISFVFANPYGCVIGLVFAILNKVQSKKYVAEFGAPTGKAKVGKGFGTYSFIMSIILLACWVLFAIVCVVLMVMFASVFSELMEAFNNGGLDGLMEEIEKAFASVQ